MRSIVRGSWPWWLAASFCAAMLASSAFAQSEPAAPGSDDRATSFQAVQGAVKEDVPGGPLLLGAYAFVWLGVLGYVLRLGRLSAHTDQNLELLQRALAASPSARDDSNNARG